MTDEKSLLSLLGMCRKAGKLSCGHDAAMGSIKTGKASLCILSCDASERLRAECARELEMAESKIPVITLTASMDEIGHATGLRSAVLTVNESGFAGSMLRIYGQSREEVIE